MGQPIPYMVGRLGSCVAGGGAAHYVRRGTCTRCGEQVVDREKPRTGEPVELHLDVDPATNVRPRLLYAYGAGPWHVYDRLAPWNTDAALAEPVTTMCGQQAQATAIDHRYAGPADCPRCTELSSATTVPSRPARSTTAWV